MFLFRGGVCFFQLFSGCAVGKAASCVLNGSFSYLWIIFEIGWINWKQGQEEKAPPPFKLTKCNNNMSRINQSVSRDSSCLLLALSKRQVIKIERLELGWVAPLFVLLLLWHEHRTERDNRTKFFFKTASAYIWLEPLTNSFTWLTVTSVTGFDLKFHNLILHSGCNDLF